MMTSSEGATFESPIFPNIIDAIKVINEGGVFLFFSGDAWNIGVSINNIERIQSLIDQKIGPQDYKFEVLVSSTKMLKGYVSHLHPKLETLVEFHEKPLSMLIKPNERVPKIIQSQPGFSVFRIVNETIIRNIIDQLDEPIVCTYAFFEQAEIPRNFGSISSDVLKMIDHIVQPPSNESAKGLLPVLIQLTKREELEFIRE